MPKTPRPLLERLQERTVIDNSTGCWIWTGPRLPTGYGTISVPGRRGRLRVGVHRVSWTLHNGPIPSGMWVRHLCDNPPCWNPEHLRLSTPADNSADMVQKGRSKFGERHWSARLSKAQIIEMRAAYAHGVRIMDLAPQYGQTQDNVWAIVHHVSWKHLP